MRLTRRNISLITSLVVLAGYFFSHAALFSNTPTSHTASPTTPDSLSIMVEPRDGIAPIISAMKAASSSVDLVIYQLTDPTIEQALIDAHKRGIAVRVLLNGGYYGKKESTINDDAYRTLSDAGIPVEWTPSYFALTHQKTLIIDDQRAYILTFNLIPKYYPTGRDFAVLDSDQVDVAAIEHAFDSDWDQTKLNTSLGSNLIWSPGAKTATLDLIAGAHNTLDVYNEEMADTAITEALVEAAQRGVVVRIIMTDNKNWHAAFDTLTHAGVHVHIFAAKDPLYIHAKSIIADTTHLFIGSQNFSEGSLTKNRELGVVTDDTSLSAAVEEIFEKDWNTARAY